MLMKRTILEKSTLESLNSHQRWMLMKRTILENQHKNILKITCVLGFRSLVSSALAFSRGWSKYSAVNTNNYFPKNITHWIQVEVCFGVWLTVTQTGSSIISIFGHIEDITGLVNCPNHPWYINVELWMLLQNSSEMCQFHLSRFELLQEVHCSAISTCGLRSCRICRQK